MKISSKYQITIPREVRKALGLEAGDRVYIGQEGNRIILRSFSKVKNPTEALYGSVKSDKDAVEAVRSFRETRQSLTYYIDTNVWIPRIG